MRHKEDEDEFLAVHEYYEFESIPGDGGKHGYTNSYFAPADTPEEMKEILQRMIADIDKHGVKDFD